MAFKIVCNDITKMNTEGIVNTASSYPAMGAGCDSAVYEAAGYEELLAYRTEKIGFVPEGEAFITPGFHLQAKYIIHAVSPLYTGGDEGVEEKLRACYRKSLQLAKENGIRSLAFPLISTGSFGYPKEEGMRIAVDEINAFLLKEELDIFLVVFDDKAKALGRRIYPELEDYINRNYLPAAPMAFAASRASVTSMESAAPRASANSREFAAPKLSCRGFLSGKEQRKAAKIAEEPRDMMEAAEAAPPEEADVYQDFEEIHESRLEERMQHISDTFSQYLLYLIRDKKMENAEVYKRAIVDKKIFSKIKNHVDYHPQKLTALCLCVGAKLNLDESKDLLARAGYALSPCDKTDIIFSYFIENGIYDMIELDIQLEEHGLPCIIS